MHIDARKIESGSIIEGDICIVGAGAAGLTIALEWKDSPFKIILLESGGFEYEDEIQDLYKGKNSGQPYFPLKSSALNYFGGTTGHWAGYCAIMDPIDFTYRDWVDNSGWPIDFGEIYKYYPRAHPVLELQEFNYSFEYWQKKFENFHSLKFDSNVLWNKMWQFSPPTRFGKKYKETIVDSKNIYLYTYACATNIQYLDINKSISGVTIKNRSGRSHTVKAKYYILACNAIQNPRLLLASNNVSKNGLGNDFDNVGRYFMDHLEIKSAELWLKNPDKLELYTLSGKPRAEFAIHAEQQKKYRILNGTVSLSLLEKVKDVKPAIETWSDDDPRKSQDKLHDAYKQKELSWLSELSSDLYKGYELFTRIEQYPNPSSRVSLDSERDSLGVPRAKLHWELSDLEKRSIRKIYELMGQQFGKHNIGRLKIMDFLIDETDHTWPSFTGGGWHHMGTTRMHDDPKKGVVDSSCKVHGINNLFIAGSSCFTTGGAVNPTLTIVALSLRLSDHLKEIMKS